MRIARIKCFSEGKSRDLSKVKSHRGLGRATGISVLTSAGFGTPGALYGGYSAKSKADKLAAEGKDDYEIIDKASSHGGKHGAVSGAISGGALGALAGGPVGILGGSAAGAIGGGLGGYFGARKNTKARLAKYKKLHGES